MTDNDPSDLTDGIIGLGIQQEATPHQQLTKADLFTAELNYARKSHTHLFVATAAYVLSEETLRDMETSPPLFDLENLRQVLIGCFVCEEPYDKRMLKRKCSGEPKRSRR